MIRSKKKLVKNVLLFLLGSQLIVSELLKGIWKALKGAGMGLIMSGPVADCALFTKSEKRWVVDQSVMVNHRAQAYFIDFEMTSGF